MSNLIIVESPTKIKTIKRYLNGDYEVVASKGHIRDLPKSKLGVDIEHDFEPQYVNIKDKESIIKDIKKLAKKATTYILRETPTVKEKLFHGISLRYWVWISMIRTE